MKNFINNFKNINFRKALLTRVYIKFKKATIYYGIFFMILAIILLFIKPLYNRGTSMNPTINDRDYFIISSLSKYKGDFHRGDVIAFIVDKDIFDRHSKVNYKLFEMSRRLLNLPPIYIKRIIALEGDTVEININGEVLVNDKTLKEDYILEKPDYTMKKITVPKGKCIVLGDNRNNSYDSSYFGPIPIKNIVGTIKYRIFPFNNLGRVY